MTAYIEKLLDRFIVNKEQKELRRPLQDPYEQAESYEKEGLSDLSRAVNAILKICLSKSFAKLYFYCFSIRVGEA